MAGPPTPPGGGPAEQAAAHHMGSGPTPPGGEQAATAHVTPDPTAALPPQDQPTAAGAPPTMPYAPQGPPAAGQPPTAAYPPGYGPGVPPSGPQQGFGPGVQSPPYGQPTAAYGGPGTPAGPGMPGGPGVPPGAAASGAAPSGGGRSRKKVLAAAAVGTALVAAAGTGIFFAMDPSFPDDGTVVYEEDFDSGETEWTDSYDAEFEEGDEYGHTQQQFALGAYEDDQQRRVSAPYGEQHPVHLSMESGLEWDSGADYAQAGMYCFGYDADDDDYEEDYRQYEITVRKDGKELVIRRNDGSDGSGTLFKTGDVSGFEGGDAANRLQVTCDRELPDPDAEVKDGTVTVRAWVNGDFVGEAVDNQPIPGRGTGLLLHRGTGGSGGDAVALFDDYRLAETAPSEEKDDDAA